MSLANVVVVNNENGQNVPEAVADTTTGALEGELGGATNVVLFVDVNHDGIVGGEDTTLYTGNLNSLAKTNIAFAAGETKYLSLNWTIPGDTGNGIQSDSATLALGFSLTQNAI